MTTRYCESLAALGTLFCAVTLTTGPALAANRCAGLPSYADLKAAAQAAVTQIQTDGVGLGNEAWATVVNRDGIVCAVAFTGQALGDQWPGSRVISAQKANTANAFSLEGEYPNVAGVGRALSSGNLYGWFWSKAACSGCSSAIRSTPASRTRARLPGSGRPTTR